MKFAQPQWLHLLWLLLGFLWFFRWSFRKKQKILSTFSSPELVEQLIHPKVQRKQKNRERFLIISSTLMVLALAQPQWGFEWEDLRQQGVDVVVTLDVSTSMMAEDIKPNRLTRAKHKIADLLSMLEGDRIGLVAFAGISFLQCPLTLDYNAAALFLNAIETDLIPVPGTAIGHALQTSLKAFNAEEKKSKAIILITDGEDHRGDAFQFAQRAKEEGVKIFTIGIGQESGAPIPDPAKGGFKKDKRGEVVISKLDEITLQKIALETGGTYVRSVTGDMDLQKIYLEDIKQTVEKKELTTTRRKLWQDRFQWFLAFALVLLCVEFVYREN